MKKENTIKLFNDKRIRVIWNDETEKYYFSVVDVVGVLTDSPNPNNYWKVLKNRLKKEGSELVTNCNQLKMPSTDGKYYKTDVADTEQLLRLIQSIPSPKAEPFKMWLAKVGYQRIEETEDPELSFERAMETYLKKGYSVAWINQRLKSIEVRKELTDEWKERRIKEGLEFAILTDEITKAWAGLTTKEYKNLKNLKKENLRDNMTNLELILNMLAEATTTEISKETNPLTFEDSKKVANEGGKIAGNTRKEIEQKTGKKIVTGLNAKTFLENKTNLELSDNKNDIDDKQ